MNFTPKLVFIFRFIFVFTFSVRSFLRAVCVRPVKFDDAAVQTPVEDQLLLNNIDENVVIKALDGFLIILSTDGDVIYVSENIHEFIGIHQVSRRLQVFI